MPNSTMVRTFASFASKGTEYPEPNIHRIAHIAIKTGCNEARGRQQRDRGSLPSADKCNGYPYDHTNSNGSHQRGEDLQGTDWGKNNPDVLRRIKTGIRPRKMQGMRIVPKMVMSVLRNQVSFTE